MIRIISDGGCDFSSEEVKASKVDIIPFYIVLDDSTHLREGIDINREDYFKRLSSEKNFFPKTSQPNPQDYLDVFTPYVAQGDDVICLTISSKLSGSYNSAKVARATLLDDYPNANILVLDSLSATVAQGLVLKEIIKMRDDGLSLDDIDRIANEVIKTTRVYFTLETVEYLKRGGRVGPTTALVSGLLGVRPILHLQNGEVAQLDSVRGKKNVIKKIEEGLTEALSANISDIKLAIGHILSEDDANTLKTNVESSLKTTIPSGLSEIGAAIGTHVGPGAIGFAYCKKYKSFV